MSEPNRELTWEYVEYIEALNERLAQQVVGISDRVQESIHGIRVKAIREAAGHINDPYVAEDVEHYADQVERGEP